MKQTFPGRDRNSCACVEDIDEADNNRLCDGIEDILARFDWVEVGGGVGLGSAKWNWGRNFYNP